MADHEVVITGIGLVGTLGVTAQAFKDAWVSGKKAQRLRLPELEGTPLEEATVAALPQVDAASRLGSRRMLKFMSDAAVLGCVAAREALQDSGVPGRFAPERIGLFSATGLAAANVQDVYPMINASIDTEGRFSCRLLGERGLSATNPLLSFKILANMPPCLISIIEDIKGPNLIFTPWEGQAAAAILEGWRAVRNGEVDCALVGGADVAAYPSTFLFLRQSKTLLDHEFPGSGAGYVLMETTESARKGGRRVHAVLNDVRIQPSTGHVIDPLAARAGRTFAAAPAILLGLACMCEWPQFTVCGVDRQKLQVKLGAC